MAVVTVGYISGWNQDNIISPDQAEMG